MIDLFANRIKYTMLTDFKIRKDKWLLLLAFILVPIVIYLYFLRIKTNVIYGDDLSTYINNISLKSFFEKINQSIASQKYRPVHDLIVYFMLELFKKNIQYYYLFNILIQTINTFLFATILNLFLRSIYMSLLFSLIVGLSRFAFFNITQLLNGGALEGVAMTFFFLSLFFILKIFTKQDSTVTQKQVALLLSILFANLSMYSHERYIVLFPFILIVLFLSWDFKAIKSKQKIFLFALVLGSVILNVLIKKFVFQIPFFVGTGGVNISITVIGIVGFFKEAILSIFEFNTGSAYLTGVEFFDLPLLYQKMVIFLEGMFLLILVMYLIKAIRCKSFIKNDTGIFILLILLLGLCLVPAIVTIRLEQRWLQASFSIFVLLVVIALKNIGIKNNLLRNSFLCIFFICFFWVDAIYFSLGRTNIYLTYAENTVIEFKKSIDDGTIRPNTQRLFIWQNKFDQTTANGINFTLISGDFFSFYQNKRKSIIFADSVYEKRHSSKNNPLFDFNKDKDQIIYINNGIFDITKNFLKDTLKNFDPNNFDVSIHYVGNKLLIDKNTFNKFLLNGFYDNENGYRWTNGNATIKLLGDFISSDSLIIQINTILLPVCKNIFPKISLKDENNRIYFPIFSKNVGFNFIYKFYFKQSTNIQEINILSDTINALPDIRKLSFPFISLEITRY